MLSFHLKTMTFLNKCSIITLSFSVDLNCCVFPLTTNTLAKESITRARVIRLPRVTQMSFKSPTGFQMFLYRNNEFISSVFWNDAGRRGSRKDLTFFFSKETRFLCNYICFCRSLILLDMFFNSSQNEQVRNTLGKKKKDLQMAKP